MVLVVLCLPAVLLSFFITLFWLPIPLMQVIVDKILVAQSMDALNVLGAALLVTSLIASGLEIGLSGLVAGLIQSQAVLNEAILRLAIVLPRVLVIQAVMIRYSPQIAALAAALTAGACGASYGLRSQAAGRYPLPLSFRLPLTLIALVVLWVGATRVLAGDLTIGQWLAMGLLGLDFTASLLNVTGVALDQSRSLAKG